MVSFVQRLGCQGKGEGLFTCLMHIYIIIHTYNEHVPLYIFKKIKRNYLNQNIEEEYITIPCVCILLKSNSFQFCI